MIYSETMNIERIVVHPMDNMKSTQFVELIKDGIQSSFIVWLDDGKEEWYWEFDITCPSDYERVKLSIFDAIFECNTMNELARVLDGVFHDGFETILIEEYEEACEHCDMCNGCKYLN